MHIVILVVLTTAVTEGGCCTIPIPPTAIEVDCQYKKLDSIPRLPPGIVKINLDGNRITSLDSRSFLGLTNLTHLYLGVNKISVIANGTFDELKSLQKLYLDENKISKIDPGLFSGLTNLTFMDLGYNNISFIPKGTFAELKSLQKLDLSDNNLNCDCDLKRALREVINRCVSLSTSSCIIGGCINKTTGERQTIWQFGNQTQCDIADCAINPCQNGGTCTDGVDSYTCSCAAGYSGRNCETEIDGCSSNPCKNGGTCKDWKNGYTCFCALGYIGLNCNTARITTRRVLSPNQTQEENITAVPTIATPQPKTTRRIISPNQTNEATRTDKPTKATLEAKTTGVSSPHQPQEVTINVTLNVNSGGSQVLPCESSTRSPDTFKWKRGGEIVSADSSRITQLSNGSLLVRNITTIDSGYYLCVAGDRILYNVTINVEVRVEVEMALRILNVEYTPDFKNKSSKKYKEFERNFMNTMDILYNSTEGYQGVIILAIRNGSTKVDFKVVVVRVIRKPSRKEPEIKVEVSGKIITRIKKKNGFIESLQVDADPKTLRLRVEPPVPESPSMGDVKATSVIVMWTEPENHEYYGIEGYVIGYRKFGSGNKWTNMTIDGQDNRRYELKSLKPETLYYVNVAAKNSFGIGVTTTPYTVTTKGAGLAGWAIALIVIMLLLLVAAAALVLWYRKRLNAQQERLRKYYLDMELQKTKSNPYDEEKNVKGLFYNPSVTSDIDCQWEEIPKEKLELSKMLGSGAFGAVYKGRVVLDGDKSIECAVKTVKENATEEEKRELWKELEIMSTVGSHPNLVNLIGANTKGDALHIVIEFAANGCLHDYLKNHRTKGEDNIESGTSIDKETKLMLALDVANGMKYLASKRCIHRDLAARNVLLTEDYRGKIADFGMSRDIYSEGVYEKKTAGKLPIRWMALEAIETFVFAKESDVWSYGVLLWEIETGGLIPWGGLNAKEIIKTLKSGKRLERPAGCTDEIYEIMTSCWNANPQGRPDCKDLSERFEKLLQIEQSNC